jgi:hypothetical protein
VNKVIEKSFQEQIGGRDLPVGSVGKSQDGETLGDSSLRMPHS